MLMIMYPRTVHMPIQQCYLQVGTSNNQGITTTTLTHAAEVDKDIKYTRK